MFNYPDQPAYSAMCPPAPSYSVYDHDEQDNCDYSEEEDNQEDHEQANYMYASDSD